MREISLVGDIGGTNARFALAEHGPDRPVLREARVLPTADFASLQEAATHYLASVDTSPRRAALGVACPVHGDEVRLTNRAWAFSRRALAEDLGLERLDILNDFGAAALGVSVLQPGEYEQLHGRDGEPIVGPVSVIGPGTGMGVALLLRDRQRLWQVVETEGGHISFAALSTEERQIHDWLAARHGRVSIERVLSGPGLAEIHAALGERAPTRSITPDESLRPPAEIVSLASTGDDPLAHAALARFCAVLGSVAGDAALFHGVNNVFDKQPVLSSRAYPVGIIGREYFLGLNARF